MMTRVKNVHLPEWVKHFGDGETMVECGYGVGLYMTVKAET